AQEILARNPEQVEAHRLLVRAYTSLRDEARLRSALEALVDAAEATGAVEDERRALTRLVRLAPEESGYRARLEELGGPLLDEEEEAARVAAAEVPTFESFMLDDNSTPTHADTADAPAIEFEWNSVVEPPRADASASFADLNDLTDAGVAAQDRSGQQQSHEQPPPSYQEFDFGIHAPDAGAHEDASREGVEGVERMLRQEIESVDFYIEQGYADIARDTLDMLERQYGGHAEIEARRTRLAAAAPAVAVEAEGPGVASVEEAAGVVFTETPQAVSDNSRPAN